jgi:8-oxo-dGTP pyrophosphatase MutT (NUDIX family)
MNDSSDIFYNKISFLLNSRAPQRLEPAHAGRAAVLMPIFDRHGDYFFLLTQRTHTVETHKGQISFPGGVLESQDDALSQTALRETWEEIGLAPEKIKILGEFDEYLSVTDLIVTPFAARVDAPFELNPNPKEVEEVLEVPLSLFRGDSNLRIEIRQRQGGEWPVYFYNFQGRDIWGLTARVIRDFLRLVDSTAPGAQ